MLDSFGTGWGRFAPVIFLAYPATHPVARLGLPESLHKVSGLAIVLYQHLPYVVT